MPAHDPDVEHLVPHRSPMLLLLEVRSELEDGLVCVGAIPTDHPFAEGSRAPAVLGVELAAQAAAAHEGLRNRRQSNELATPNRGYLVSIARARFRDPFLPVGQRLMATVRLVATAGPLGSYLGVIWREGVPRAHMVVCRFSTFRIAQGT